MIVKKTHIETVPYRVHKIGHVCSAQELRYSPDQPRDNHGRWTAEGGTSAGLTSDSGSGTMNSGAISGGLKPDSDEAQKHAELYYNSVRKMKTDVANISKNTGFSEEEISRVKNHVFLEKHDLGGSLPEYFYPNYEMAQSWQRLIDGKDIQPHDITLIRHELMESGLMELGYSQEDAHRETESLYNYAKESGEYYAKTDKHNNE